MATRKPTNTKPNGKPGPTGKKKGKGKADPLNGYASVAWKRVHLLSVELTAIAHDLGMHAKKRDPDGFDLADAARELARLAGNHNREVNPDGRTMSQEKADWVAIGGLGADLGNMADEGILATASDGVRHVAYELCFLTCDYLF
jgi:hypothetical protein